MYRVLLPVVIIDGCPFDLPGLVFQANSVAGERALIASLARAFHVGLSFLLINQIYTFIRRKPDMFVAVIQ